MAQEFDYLLCGKISEGKILLAIPMYMYRIQTFQIESDIDLLQKAVLMFKAAPGIKNGDIAKFLGLDVGLVQLISQELRRKGLIDANDLITSQGKDVKDGIDSLVADSKKRYLGYVFQYLNGAGLYPYYVNQIQKAPALGRKVCIGSKGFAEEDRYQEPISAEELMKHRVVNPAPSEQEIVALIRRSAKQCQKGGQIGELDFLSLDSSKYGISFIPNDQPMIVWVCTYAYLPKLEGSEDVYANDWCVDDPFGFAGGTEFRCYVESLLKAGLIEDFTREFRDLTVEDDRKFAEFQVIMDRRVDEKMDYSFNFRYRCLSENIRDDLKRVVSNYLKYRRSDLDAAEMFFIYAQRVLEAILLSDFGQFEGVYKKVTKEKPPHLYITELLDSGILKVEREVQKKIKRFAESFDPNTGASLKHYLLKFLLAHQYNQGNPLYGVILGNVDLLYKIADYRNRAGHGRSGQDKSHYQVSSDELEAIWSGLKQLINNYIDISNNG